MVVIANMASIPSVLVGFNDTSRVLHSASDMLPIADNTNVFTIMSSMLLFLVVSLGGLMQLKVRQLSKFILVELNLVSSRIVHAITTPDLQNPKLAHDNLQQEPVRSKTGEFNYIYLF